MNSFEDFKFIPHCKSRGLLIYIISAFLTMILTCQPHATAISADFNYPPTDDTTADPNLTISGWAAAQHEKWELEAPSDFQNGSWDHTQYVEGTGVTLAARFQDAFDGTSIDNAIWTVDSNGGIVPTCENGELKLAGSENAQVWGGTDLRTRVVFNGTFSLFARMRVQGEGSGYGINFGFWISQDVYFRCGPLYDQSRNRNSILYVNYKNGPGGDEGIQSDDDARNINFTYRWYGLEYNSSNGEMKVLLDGTLKATKQWVAGASGYSVFIGSWARMNGDKVDARLDGIHSGYETGIYESIVRVVGDNDSFLDNIEWKAGLPQGTEVTCAVRSGPTPSDLAVWTPLGNGQPVSIPLENLFQFRLSLTTTDPASSPAVKTIDLRWGPRISAASVSLDAVNWTLLNGTENWSGQVKLERGLNNISVLVNDTAGNFIIMNRSVWYFQAPEIPKGRVLINGNDTYTCTTAVTLSLYVDAEPRVLSMRVSNTPDLSNARWLPFQSILNWTLPPGDGEKLVYVSFLSGDGVPSHIYSDNIVLDTRGPDITIFRPFNNSTTFKKIVGVYGSASDLSGVRSVEIRVNGGNWSRCIGLESWSANIILSVIGPYRMDIRATDNVGNQNMTSIRIDRNPTLSGSTILPDVMIVGLLVLILFIYAYVVIRIKSRHT